MTATSSPAPSRISARWRAISKAALGEAETVKAVWLPQTQTALDEEKAATMLKVLDLLEEDDDVQNVYSNFEVSDEMLEKLTAA